MKHKWPSSSLDSSSKSLQFLTPTLWQKSSPGSSLPTEWVLPTLLKNTETGSPVCLILVATSSTISASTAESNLHLSGPFHPCSDNDGRAVPELKVYSYLIYVAQLSIHLLKMNCPCCRGRGSYSSESVTGQHLSWSWLGHCYLELPLLFPTAVFKISGDKGSLVPCISAAVDMSLGNNTALNKGSDNPSQPLPVHFPQGCKLDYLI